MDIRCEECMYIRSNIDSITGELTPYCGAEEDKDYAFLVSNAPKWCPLIKEKKAEIKECLQRIMDEL